MVVEPPVASDVVASVASGTVVVTALEAAGSSPPKPQAPARRASAATAAAVLAYRIILFWLPLVVGGLAFALLRRDMPSGREFAACKAAIAKESLPVMSSAGAG